MYDMSTMGGSVLFLDPPRVPIIVEKMGRECYTLDRVR